MGRGRGEGGGLVPLGTDELLSGEGAGPRKWGRGLGVGKGWSHVGAWLK